MNLIQTINDKMFELYKGYEDVSRYMLKWIEYYDSFGNQNFYIRYKDYEQKKIDVGENGAFPPTRNGCIHSLSMRERG